MQRTIEIAVGPGHAILKGAGRLFPEVFDGMLRVELIDLGELPPWASPAIAEEQRAA